VSQDRISLYPTMVCSHSCIICPNPHQNQADRLSLEIMKRIVVDAGYLSHVTISGGEPTLIGEELVQIIEFIIEQNPGVFIQVLSHGGAFASQSYTNDFRAFVDNVLWEIPFHSSNILTFERITGKRGSFHRTLDAIDSLIAIGAQIHLRVVINKLNFLELEELSKFFIDRLPGVKATTFIAMEYSGECQQNFSTVWAPYKSLGPTLQRTIPLLLLGGVETYLFNFPLCTIPENLWSLAKDSISQHKKIYFTSCRKCVAHTECGGFFRTNSEVLSDEILPILS
jgi:His-Xaa-Ser system radical SAM maturase HxsC